jgi:hypothetical protein
MGMIWTSFCAKFHPSRPPAFGHPIRGALSFGLPVLAFNCRAISRQHEEVVKHRRDSKAALDMRLYQRKFSTLPVGDERSKLGQKHHDEIIWLNDQLTKLPEIFSPDLGFASVKEPPVTYTNYCDAKQVRHLLNPMKPKASCESTEANSTHSARNVSFNHSRSWERMRTRRAST